MKKLLTLLSLLVVAVSMFAQTLTVDGLEYGVLSEKNKTVQLIGGANAVGDVVVPTSIIVPGTGRLQDIQWTTQSGPDWTNSVDENGNTVYKSGTIGGNESTVLRCTFRARGTIAFMCRYQGEDGCDYLTIGDCDVPCTRDSYSTSLNGTSGTWRQIVISPSDENEHYVEFCYSKDGSVTVDPDCAEVYLTVFEGGNYSVASISDGCTFKFNTNITSITIPESFGFTTIPNMMFYGCTALESFSIPNVTSIGDYAFYHCSSLSSVSLPAVTSIGSYAFNQCSSLSSVSLPAVTSIGSYAFNQCSKISSLRIGSVEQWCNAIYGEGSSPLRYASSSVNLFIDDSDTPVADLVIPNTVLELPNDAFSRTTITSVSAPFVTSIGSYAFYECSFLASVEIPAAESIGDWAFYHCSSLSSVSLPAVTSIGSYAFYECSSLSSVSLPAVTSICSYAFYQCSKISSLRIGSVEQWCNVLFNNIYCNPLYSSQKVNLYVGDSNTPATELTIPSNVSQIPAYCYYGLSLHTINFEGATPPALINTNAIPTWTMLAVPDESYETYLATDVYKTIPLQITKKSGINQVVDVEADNTTSKLLQKIGEDEVRYVVNLKISGTINSYDMLIIRNRMTSLRNLDLSEASILDCDFAYSTSGGNSYHSVKDEITGDWLMGLMNVKLPANTKAIGYGAFRNCNRLVGVDIPDGVESIGSYAFYGCNRIKELTLPQSVTSFGAHAFHDCTGLREVVIPAGVTSISSYAFNECRDLEKVTIPATVKNIGYYAFTEVGNQYWDDNRNEWYRTPISLRISDVNLWLDAEIGESGVGAFDNVETLFIGDSDQPVEEIVIPAGTTELKRNTFSGFSCLKSVTLPDELTTIGVGTFLGTGLTEVKLPKNLNYIGSYAFSSCTNLENVEFTDSLKNIGEYAFSDCYNLKKIELPSYLQTIGSGAFHGCSSLTEVLVPASIQEIGDYAFQDCNSLNTVIATTVEPITINQNTFSTYTTANVYSPKTSYWKYYWNTQWNQFLSVNEYGKKFGKHYGYKYFYLRGHHGGKKEDFEISDETGTIHGTEDDVTGIEKAPDADFGEESGIVIGGEQIQELGDIHIHHNGNNGASVIAKNNGKVHIDNLYVDIKTQKNRWYFFCFPFDINPGEAAFDGSHVWYLYDGESRALNGNGGWKKVANDGVMQSGNGYIFQGAVNGTLTIHVQDITIDTSDTSTNMITYQSDNKNDASWNLIGNSNFAYYDIDNLGYDVPITVYNNETGNYEAVRAGEDDYELYPFQAFFVQKPEGTESMDFDNSKKDTKNKSDEKKAKKAAERAKAPKKVDSMRKVINLEIAAVDVEADSIAAPADRTRIVVNPTKSTDYETDCDAAKFIAENIAQIYSLDTDGCKYAINERPVGNGVVDLAVKSPKDGFYTISAPRLDCDAKLRDLETGSEVDLAKGGYTFAAEATTYTKRFQLVLGGTTDAIMTPEMAASAIGVENGAININAADADVKVYSVGGSLVATHKGTGSINVTAGAYVVVVNGQSVKVTVNE